MRTTEWWSTRDNSGHHLVMHVSGKGAIYHPFFYLEDSETCPACKEKIPDGILLGIKIGAL